MEHEQIDQYDLIDRYLLGKLPADEIARFEEHFIDCPQCIARLHTTKTFLQDLRYIAAEQASRAGRRQLSRAFKHIWQARFRKSLALALGCLLIAAIAGFALVNLYTRRLRAEMSQAKNLSEQWERRYEDERQAAFSADRKRQEAESQLAEQQRVLAAKLKDEQAQRPKMAAELGRQMRPDDNPSIFILSSVRGAESNAAGAAKQISLQHASAMFILGVSLEEEMTYKSYGLTILDQRRQVIWTGRRSAPNQYNSLLTLLRRDLFRPGHYSLIVKGVKTEGGVDVVGDYPFLITQVP
jgi:Putative zinc-finger